MDRIPPRTPFSTPFSPSKKMVEARIRGVIAGPQKRPPLPLLVLVLAFCFFSVNLVSCQPAQVEDGPDASATSVQDSVQDPIPAEPDASPFPYTDLNRNGIPETIETFVDIDSGTHRLTITENGEVVYTTTAWNDESNREAVFLYRDGEGKDWLLRYRPILYSSGRGEYLYQVYCPNDAEEFSTPYKWLTFDLSFSGGVGGYNDFDPEAIAAYIGEVNALLADSTLLICSDSNLKAGFNRLGRLEDDLWWINLDYIRDPDKPLVETLREYQAVKEAAVSERPAVPYVPAPGTPEPQAALDAFRAVLEGKATFYSADISRNVDMNHIGEVLGLSSAVQLYAAFTLVDLDRDGVQELALYYRLGNGGTIVILHYQSGEVYGYYKFGRGFQNAKTDGTYTGSGGAFTRYLLRITSFDRSGFEEETTAYYDYHDPNTFMLHDQPSTEQAVTALFDQHDAKEDVTWYDLNDANIKAAFS